MVGSTTRQSNRGLVVVLLAVLVIAQMLSVPLQAIALLSDSAAVDPQAHVPGFVMIRLAATGSQGGMAPMIGSGRASVTGIAAVDAVLASYGLQEVTYLGSDLGNPELGSSLGLDRDLVAVIDSSADVFAVVAALNELSEVEVANPDWAFRVATEDNPPLDPEPDTLVPNDPLYYDNWGHNNRGVFPAFSWTQFTHEGGAPVGTIGFDSDADRAWYDYQLFGSSDVVIAILDTGVDPDHPDLTLVPGWNVDGNNSDISDNVGHGTACAGVAAAVANNALGAAGIAGGCSIMPVKISNSGSSIQTSKIEQAIIYAADHGADIISMSFGGSQWWPGLDAAVEYARRAGVVLFAASGNARLGGFNAYPLAFPAGCEKVVAVGAASPCGERKGFGSCDGEYWWSSMYGAGLDLLAPTILPTTDITGPQGYDAGDYFKWFNGTSCATPYAAGVAALVLSAQPNLTPDEVEQRLAASATDIMIGGGTVGYDTLTGWGLVNADKALRPVNFYNSTIYVGPNEAFTTIQAAIDAAPDRTQILVKPGNYSEFINFHGKPIWLKSVAGPLVTTISAPSNGFLVTFSSGESHFAVLEGFKLQGGSRGVNCQESAPTIRGNIIEGAGIGVYAGSKSCGACFFARTPATIVNNTIVNCQVYGIWTTSEDGAVTIRNNIIAFNQTGVYRYNISYFAQPLLQYNNVYGNTTDYANVNPGVGSISVDPLLGTNWQLLDGSPCVDAGDPAPEWNDADGSRNDMGALPYVPSEVDVPADYPTIQTAIDAVYNGSTITVADGVYSGSINFKGKSIAVVSAGGPTRSRINGGPNAPLVVFEYGEGSGTRLEGFTLDGGSIGVVCRNAAPTLRHNIFNAQRGTSAAAIVLEGVIPGTIGNSPATIINNTLQNGLGGGILCSSVSPPTIMNSIVYHSAGYGIKYSGPADSSGLPQLAYNCVYGNAPNYVSIPGPGTGSIAVAPQLWPNGSLRWTSPCIDAGNPDPAFNDPDSSRNDMGAVPYQEPIIVERKLLAGQQDPPLPTEFELSQNVPNPFNPSTQIAYALPKAGHVEIIIYNILGQRVKTLIDQESGAGYYSVIWDGTSDQGQSVASGVYLYKLRIADFSDTKKMLMLK